MGVTQRSTRLGSKWKPRCSSFALSPIAASAFAAISLCVGCWSLEMALLISLDSTLRSRRSESTLAYRTLVMPSLSLADISMLRPREASTFVKPLVFTNASHFTMSFPAASSFPSTPMDTVCSSQARDGGLRHSWFNTHTPTYVIRRRCLHRLQQHLEVARVPIRLVELHYLHRWADTRLGIELGLESLEDGGCVGVARAHTREASTAREGVGASMSHPRRAHSPFFLLARMYSLSVTNTMMVVGNSYPNRCSCGASAVSYAATHGCMQALHTCTRLDICTASPNLPATIARASA